MQDYYLIQICDLKHFGAIVTVLAQNNDEFIELLKTINKHKEYFITKVEVFSSFQTVGAFINSIKFENEYKEKEFGVYFGDNDINLEDTFGFNNNFNLGDFDEKDDQEEN